MRLMLRFGEGGDGGGGWFELPRMRHFILRPDKTLEEVDMLTQAAWIQAQWRLVYRRQPNLIQVGRKTIAGYGHVSTVFLALEVGLPSFGEAPRPPFETMWFGPDGPDVMGRYHTWEQAQAGHRAVVRAIRRYQPRLEQAGRAGDSRRMVRCELFIRTAARGRR